VLASGDDLALQGASHGVQAVAGALDQPAFKPLPRRVFERGMQQLPRQRPWFNSA